MNILIENAGIVFTQNDKREVLRDTSIYISGGIIKEIGKSSLLKEKYTPDLVLDASKMAVLPGLVNLHTHSVQVLLRGRFDEPLMNWLRLVDLEYEKLDDADTRAAARLTFIEGLLCGTTTFLDMEGNVEPIVSAAREVGIRLYEAIALVDTAETGVSGFTRVADPEEEVKIALKVAREKMVTGQLNFLLGPVGFPSSSPELLRIASEEARKNGLKLHAHLSESMVNEELSRKMFGLSETGMLEKIGFLGPDVIVAHGVNLDPIDIQVLAKHGVNVAHCPTSNAKLGNGIAPALKMINQGLNVGLGTDGAASNDSLDLFSEMKTFILMQRSREGFDRRVNAQLALDMATRNGGLALDSSGKLGVISLGAYADLVLVDLTLPSMLPSEKVLDNLVFSGGCRAVRHVIVNGELLVYDGRLRNEELYRRALEEFNEAAKRVSYK